MSYTILDHSQKILSIGQGAREISWKPNKQGHVCTRFSLGEDGSLYMEITESYLNKRNKYKHRSLGVELNAGQTSMLRDFLSCKELTSSLPPAA